MASSADPDAITAVPELSGGTHFPCLDAYRAIGMTMVLLVHASFATGFDDRSEWGRYISRLDLAVPMFFVLSGFLLYRPFAKAALRDRPPLSSNRFYRRRALRVFPAYWVALLGIVVIFGAKWMDSLWGWVANVFALQQFGVEEPYRITQAWSIGVEISFYLILPLFAVVTQRLVRDRPPRSRVNGLYLSCLLLLAAGQAFRIAVVVLSPSWESQSLLWLPMYLDFFAIGMMAAVASAAPSTGIPGPRWVDRLAGHAAACWLTAAAVVLLVAQMDPPDEPFGLNGAEYLPRQLAYGLASFLWLLPAMFGNQQEGRLRAFLRSRPLVYLGAISLSFYLWHLEMIEAAKSLTVDDYAAREARAALALPDSYEALLTFTGNVLVVTAVAFALTLAVAAVVHRFVELPFLRLRDRPLRQLPEAFRESLPRPRRAG